jgi:hypothetical protein
MTGSRPAGAITLPPPSTKSGVNSYWRFGRFGFDWDDLGRVVIVDVPPDIDGRAARERLGVGERDGVWSVEEGYCATGQGATPS